MPPMGVVKQSPITDGFRAKRKTWFLTYPRTPKRLTPRVYLKRLPLILGDRFDNLGLESYMVVQELHKESPTKGFHLHCLLKFKNELETENSRLWDVDYYNQNYHPNDAGAVRSWHKTIRYLLKDPVEVETNIPTEDQIPKLLWIAKNSASDLEYLEEKFYQTSMRASSLIASQTADKLRTLYKNQAQNFDELFDPLTKSSFR